VVGMVGCGLEGGGGDIPGKGWGNELYVYVCMLFIIICNYVKYGIIIIGVYVVQL
jgi:hypothetical protein